MVPCARVGLAYQYHDSGEFPERWASIWTCMRSRGEGWKAQAISYARRDGPRDSHGAHALDPPPVSGSGRSIHTYSPCLVFSCEEAQRSVMPFDGQHIAHAQPRGGWAAGARRGTHT